MNARALGLVVAVAVAGVGAAAPADAATTISGSLGGGRLPSKSAGVASVRAVAAETGVVAADARTAAGRFVLKVKSGAYVLLATTTPFRGRAGVDRKVEATRVATALRAGCACHWVRRGGHIRAQAQALRRGRRRAPASSSVTYPAVWVQHFAVSGPEEASVLRKGIADMLINDLIPPVKKKCEGVLVEREHLDLIIAEQELSRRPAGRSRRAHPPRAT